MKVIVMKQKPFGITEYDNIDIITDVGEYYELSDKDNDYKFNKDNHRLLVTEV